MIKKVYFILVDIDVHVINVLFIIMKYSKNVQDVDKNQKVLYLKYIISNCIIFLIKLFYIFYYILSLIIIKFLLFYNGDNLVNIYNNNNINAKIIILLFVLC